MRTNSSYPKIFKITVGDIGIAESANAMTTTLIQKIAEEYNGSVTKNE